MANDPSLLDELKRLRARVRELEQQLVTERDLALSGELATEVLRSLVSDAGVFVTIYDRQGRMVYQNRTDQHHALDEVINQSVFDWTKPEYHAALQSAFESVWREGVPVQVEAEGIRGGRWRNWLGPINVNGRVVAVSNFNEDVAEQRYVEQKLRESEARWRSLAESVPDSVVVLDLQGRVQFANRLRQLTHDQIHQMSAHDLVAPEFRAQVAETLEKVRSTGEAIDMEAQDAFERHWFVSRIAPLWGDGSIRGTISVSHDISERKQREEALREQEARLRFLVDNMPAITWTVNREMVFTSSRGRGLRGLGLEPEEIVGRSLHEYFRVLHDDQEPVASHRRALNGQSVTYEHNWNGRRYHTLIEPVRDEKGEVTSAVGVAVDITDRWAVERQVRDDRDELERRVAERTEELKAVNQSLLKERTVLQRLLDLHDRDQQLTAYEIHDGIVQDMTAALLFYDSSAEAAQQKGGRAAEGHQHGAQLLRNAIQEARRLINGLRPPVLDEFGLWEGIANYIESLRSTSEVQVEFERDTHFDRLAPVVETAIYRIVQEALNNVVQHSQATHAKVTAHQQNELVYVSVQDWGCGFDIKAVKAKRFGLLSIRDRSRLLGGEAEILSRPGKGTTIQVVLPIGDVLLPGAIKETADDSA